MNATQTAIRVGTLNVPSDALNKMVDAACRAHWASWDNMRPDNQRKWRDLMHVAVVAALTHIKFAA